MRNDDQLWQELKWTQNAQYLLSGLSRFSAHDKINVMIRHSERFEIMTLRDNLEAPLTDNGKKMAYLFGTKLPKNRITRFFHSPVDRCRETAVCICHGFQDSGGHGSVVGIVNELFDIDVDGGYFYKNFQKYPNEAFLYRWSAGLFPSDSIMAFIDFSKKAALAIQKESEQKTGITGSAESCMDFFVSHDLMILAFRLGWFGLSPDNKWPSFLGCYAFTVEKDIVRLLDFDSFKAVDKPYFWKD